MLPSSRRGEEEDGMPVREPMLSQNIQSNLRQWDIPVFLPLSRADMDQHPGGRVNVRDAEIEAFRDAQAQGVQGK